jgi:hypothetical protein
MTDNGGAIAPLFDGLFLMVGGDRVQSTIATSSIASLGTVAGNQKIAKCNAIEPVFRSAERKV